MSTAAPPSGFGAELRRVIGLAGPLTIAHVGQHLMSVVDTAMLGRYSEAAMAGAGIASGILFAITVVGVGLMLGLDTLVPQALGAGQPGLARTYFRAGLRLAALASLPLVGALAAAALALPHGGLDPEVASEARRFLLWRLPGIYPFLVIIAQRSFLQAHGRTRAVVVVMVVGNLVNFGCNYLFIFGDDGLARLGLPPIGLPRLGVIGSALATTVVSVLGALALQRATRRIAATGAPPSRADVSYLARLGLPVGLHLLAEVGVFALALYMAGRLHGHAAAGHQVAISLASLSFAMALGAGAAAAVRVGHAIGAGDTPAARRAGSAALLVGVLAMAASGVLFAALPEALARIFTADAAVIAAAAPLIQIAAVFQLSDAIQAVAAGALRGAGDTRATFVANLVGHYAIGLPIALGLAFGAELGAPGLWWGLTAGLTAVALFLAIRFYRLTSRPVASRLEGP